MSVDLLDWQCDKAENAVANVIFAHGAGANMNSDFINEFTDKLVAQQLNVFRFNFPYMTQREIDGKRRPPNKMDVLVAEFQKIIAAMDDSLPLFIGGKSMGGRVAAMVSDQESVMGVFCVGYPFHPQKKPEKLRLEPLQLSSKPIVILQGTRDALGSQEEIEQYQLDDNIQLHYFADGDHDLKPRVKSGFVHAQHKHDAAIQVANFISKQITAIPYEY